MNNASVIQEKMTKAVASKWIEGWASKNISAEDQPRFIEITESELIGLHDGNFARYKVKPSEFYGWKQLWES
jgi:hypothetical protein